MQMAEQIYFSWQNPVLRNTIYPFREQKLRDFLLTYREIDLWKARNDPSVLAEAQAEAKRLAAELKAERARIEQELQVAIAQRKLTDKWFAVITGDTQDRLYFKYSYYLDREILRLTEAQAVLVDRQKSLRRRIEWYTEGDTRRQLWEDRAKELDPPLKEATTNLEEAVHLGDLLEAQKRLPKLDPSGELSLEDAVRYKLEKYQKELNALDHDQLIERVEDFFDEQRPSGRFEKWVEYMVIHFSGMRYKSSHGSWADPRYLLELLTWEFLSEEIDDMDEAALKQACQEAIAELEEEKTGIQDPNKIKAIDRQISRLQLWNPRRTLAEYRMARELGEIQALPDDEKIFTDKLEELRVQKQGSKDSIPDWMWDEITKYTSLRLETQQADWEKTSPERWQYENYRWRSILDTWERKDITGWRQRHEKTLDLVVTRAVCNEIAEHIQHLRGLIPGAGLTAKPIWYINRMKADANLPPGSLKKSYFKRATSETDFRNGASILWLGWTNVPPNPWQVANSIPGFDLVGGRDQSGDSTEWGTYRTGNSFTRVRKKPSIKELKNRGKSKEEIEAIKDDLRRNGGVVHNYLRWTHEATAIEVADLIDGKYVLTFETGQIGLIRRRLTDLAGNSNVFVGFTPKEDKEPEELNEMIDRSRILLSVTKPVERAGEPVARAGVSFGLMEEMEQRTQEAQDRQEQANGRKKRKKTGKGSG
jgi:hypothetical protein